MDDLKVNDGKGLLDNLGMIDSLIVDCNTAPRFLFNGENVAFCAKIVEMVQQLSRLREGVETDTKALRDEVDELRRAINDLTTGKGDDSDV